ncbi:MAG: DUF4364 family protein [Lachnospiraceae bacterium]|nr:DUF4364 family protein [Lachnospiraceae bacterium]
MDAEKLTQVKLIILYMLARVDFLMTASQISDFVLGKDYADFYVLTQAQGELIDNGLISQAPHSHNATELSITTEGRDTIKFFGSRLPDFIKNDIENYFADKAFELRNELAVKADYVQNSATGEYETRLIIKDRDVTTLDMTLSVPTEEIAEHIVDVWKEKATGVFQYITNELF